MRTVRYTNRFKRDYKREIAGRHGRILAAELTEVVRLLAGDSPLPRRNFDHPLSGEWRDHRDCHVRPDLILIYSARHCEEPRRGDEAIQSRMHGSWIASLRSQ
jgi:mRNA interferase YafQ